MTTYRYLSLLRVSLETWRVDTNLVSRRREPGKYIGPIAGRCHCARTICPKIAFGHLYVGENGARRIRDRPGDLTGIDLRVSCRHGGDAEPSQGQHGGASGTIAGKTKRPHDGDVS